MCNNCYHKQGREKKAWNCEHTNRAHYAKGKCQNCYLNFYHKVKLINLRNKFRRKRRELMKNLINMRQV